MSEIFSIRITNFMLWTALNRWHKPKLELVGNAEKVTDIFRKNNSVSKECLDKRIFQELSILNGFDFLGCE